MKTYALTKFSNQNRTRRNAFPQRLSGPLSNEQKARLCILAREGYALAFTDQPFADWRHEQQELAVGKASLCDCVQDDYLALKAHFQRLAGEEGDALRTETRHGTEDRRVAMRKLEVECAARKLALSYPAAICRRQFKCALNEATVKQLWMLVFTVRNRRKK